MLSVLIEGTLTAAPVQRTTVKGQPFATAKIREAGEDGETVWCSVITFNADAVEGLAALTSGDSVAIAGHAAISTWEKGGEHRAGLKVTASRVLSVYAAGKRRAGAGPQHTTADDGRGRHE